MAPNPKLDLSKSPPDRWQSAAYRELFELWQEIVRQLGQQPLEPDHFKSWERRVLALLRPAEQDYFLQSGDPDAAWHRPIQQEARRDNLKRILLARKGLGKLS
jgi:hypothetical protein